MPPASQAVAAATSAAARSSHSASNVPNSQTLLHCLRFTLHRLEQPLGRYPATFAGLRLLAELLPQQQRLVQAQEEEEQEMACRLRARSALKQASDRKRASGTMRMEEDEDEEDLLEDLDPIRGLGAGGDGTDWPALLQLVADVFCNLGDYPYAATIGGEGPLT